MIGFTTRQTLTKLLNDGSIDKARVTKFYTSVRAFFCPLDDQLLNNAVWLDFDQRLEITLDAVEYFVGRYSNILGDLDVDKLSEQFIEYQLLSDEDLPDDVRALCLFGSDLPKRIDILWGYLKGVKIIGTNVLQFDLLFRVY